MLIFILKFLYEEFTENKTINYFRKFLVNYMVSYIFIYVLTDTN